jgi:DNA-directed RNA polymerase specialized sigma24 family protein
MGIDDQDFDDFILRLDPACTDPKDGYKRLRFKLIKFFAWRRCDDPETLADETIARLAGQIIAKKAIRSEWAFVFGIATNVFREYLRDKRRQEKLENALTDVEIPPHQFDVNDCQSQCWNQLERKKQEILKKYYNEEHRDTLAESLGVTINALRLQIHRIKCEFKACEEKCRKEKPER